MATGNTSDVSFENVDFDRLTIPKNFINKGAFGEVFGPFSWNSKKCALKRIWKRHQKSDDDFKVRMEVQEKTWTSLRHKNLIETYKVILRPKTLYLLLEYASGGSLTRLLHDSDAAYNRKISNWARQIAEGMLYLHEADIVHRDLKCNNIMLSEPFDPMNAHEDITLKITDFDEVRELDHTAKTSFKGTCAYTAPEVLNEGMFSKASDIWSYGVVIWEMLTRKRAHEELAQGELIQQAASGQLILDIPESVSKTYKKFLCGCLHLDKGSRLSFHNIINQLLSIDKDRNQTRVIMQKLKQRKKEKGQPAKKLEQEIKGMALVMSQVKDPQLFGFVYKSEPVLVQVIITKATEKEKKSIRGMTILDKELFVVNEESSTVEVYDSMKFSFSRRWNLEELTEPTDMVSCNRNKCLYIYGYIGNSGWTGIVRVDPDGKLITKWSTGDNDGYSLSVTDESNIVLTVNKKFHEYSPDGQLVREISLPSGEGIVSPWHAVKLANGHFVVSSGYVDELHRICVVDGNGKLKKSFGGKQGSTVRQMRHPVHLVVGGNGFVMVADFGNRRILLLDSDLEFKREILSEEKHELRVVERILLDQTNSRLFVADNYQDSENRTFSDGRILIFQFG